jgi:hypothetical protein
MTVRIPRRFWAATLAGTVVGLALAGVVRAQPPGPQTASRAQGAGAGRPLTDAEGKLADELVVEQKRLDTHGARVMAASPDGRRRVADTIARSLGVSDKVVNDLRGRRLTYGDATIALSLSQQLARREKGLSQSQAVEKVVTPRKAGQGWGVVARDLGLKLTDVIGDVKRTDKELAKLDALRLARKERPAATARPPKVVR